MLQPRETDIPALFLVLVVLPLVSYILLGKWNEAAKKKERVGLLAQRAAEEAFKSETVPAVSIIPTPLVPLPSSAIHQCARCHSPATTRCSQCKSVRYWYDQVLFVYLCSNCMKFFTELANSGKQDVPKIRMFSCLRV